MLPSMRHLLALCSHELDRIGLLGRCVQQGFVASLDKRSSHNITNIRNRNMTPAPILVSHLVGHVLVCP